MSGGADLRGKKVLVMGLGLNGGGAEVVRYCAARGADVLACDLKSREELGGAFDALAGVPFAFVRQDECPPSRVAGMDILVKNPAVRPDHPWLALARRVETDLSLFLAACPARLVCVTGSKGKSTVSAAVHFALEEARRAGLLSGRAALGGNIGRSPLSFLDGLGAADDVTLELSSFQLGDIGRYAPPGLLKPRIAVFTAIMSDHRDRYGDMESYVADKRVLYRAQDGADALIAPLDGWGLDFARESRARPLLYAAAPGARARAFLDDSGAGLARLEDGGLAEITPAAPRVPGARNRLNLLAAALALVERGLPPEFIRGSLAAFPGLPHRLEFFCERGGVRFYNDSAATIPEAALAALEAFDRPVILVAGGADKNLDLAPLVGAARKAKAVVLLCGARGKGGTGTRRLIPLLREAGVTPLGPFAAPEAALAACRAVARPGDAVVLSPGFASFDMFDNEFDRGDRWKAAVLR